MSRDTVVVVHADEVTAIALDMGLQPILGMRVKKFNVRLLHSVVGHLKVSIYHTALGVLYKQDVALQVGVQFSKVHELVLVV